MLKQRKIKITLLSTGLTLKRHAENIVKDIDDIIISLDGDELLHDEIRNIPFAFQKLKNGTAAIREIKPTFRISARSVIHRLNFRKWAAIIEAAKKLRLHSISFLPADTTSNAFNRPEPWDAARREELNPSLHELPEFKQVLEDLIRKYNDDFVSGFIAESPDKLRKIYMYYAAGHGLNSYPPVRCNAPWVSAVIEADGEVRPCFFHERIGNIRTDSLDKILNSANSVSFRKALDMEQDPVCQKCVCYLRLSPQMVP